jgi:hypothetical protein
VTHLNKMKRKSPECPEKRYRQKRQNINKCYIKTLTKSPNSIQSQSQNLDIWLLVLETYARQQRIYSNIRYFNDLKFVSKLFRNVINNYIWSYLIQIENGGIMLKYYSPTLSLRLLLKTKRLKIFYGSNDHVDTISIMPHDTLQDVINKSATYKWFVRFIIINGQHFDISKFDHDMYFDDINDLYGCVKINGLMYFSC